MLIASKAKRSRWELIPVGCVSSGDLLYIVWLLYLQPTPAGCYFIVLTEKQRERAIEISLLYRYKTQKSGSSRTEMMLVCYILSL
jgi:hypothetical protein